MSRTAGTSDGVTTCAETSWTACLEAFRGHLTAQLQAVQAGQLDDISAFVPPHAMPPLPRGLVPAATQLLAQAEELERALTLAGENVRRQLRLARRMDVTSPPASSYVEQRA